MSIKILFALIGTEDAELDLKTAISLVKDTEIHLSVLILGLTIPISDEYAIASTWFEQRQIDAATITEAHRRADQICRQEGIAYDIDSFFDDRYVLESYVRTRALYVDLVAVGQSVRADKVLRDSVVTAVVFHAETPLMLIPLDTKISLRPKSVMVAWNSRPEAMNAAKAALGFLQSAEITHIVLVDPDVNYYKNGGQPGADFALFLARHGVNATIEEVASGKRPTNEVIRQHAFEIGCDMIVMGAYGHARIFERVFGGVTHSVIERCPLPVFLAR